MKPTFEYTKQRAGLFNDNDKIDMKVKKDIWNLTFDCFKTIESLNLQKYTDYLKLFNKYSEGKSKKFPKGMVSILKMFNSDHGIIDDKHFKEIINLFESEVYNYWSNN